MSINWKKAWEYTRWSYSKYKSELIVYKTKDIDSTLEDKCFEIN